MDAHNDRTLAAYEAHVVEYLATSSPVVSPVLAGWLDDVLAPYPRARVLEIGSGPGTIAEHLMANGHQVDLTDATTAFVEHLRQRGHPVSVLNVLTDPVPAGYDVILANAVFLHLTREQLTETLARLQAALAPGGRLAFTVKQGDGEEWSTEKLGAPRYFCYWQPEPLRDVVVAAGFTPVQVTGWSMPSGQEFLGVIADAAAQISSRPA